MIKKICVIPAKSESVRIPKKNLTLMPNKSNKSLVWWTVYKAIRANCFDCIAIDTNDEELYKIASDGFSQKPILIKRNKDLTKPGVTGNDILIEEYNKIGKNFDYMFQLFCTAPFIKPETISTVAENLIKNNQFDSTFTAIKQKSYFWTKEGIPLYDVAKQEHGNNWPYLWEESFGFYGIKSSIIPITKARIGKYPLIHEIKHPENIDINYPDDLLKVKEIGEKTKWEYL
jgi:CMP-N-acetylneuraminic acid synthetase